MSNLPEATTTGPPGVPPAAERRVLAVDDEASVLAALRRLFRRDAYTLLTAGGADEALRILEAQPVQVVISDYRMPGRNGVELLRTIQERWPDTVRIVMSGYSEVRTIIAAINDGAIYKFIAKPWNDEEVRLHVWRAIEQAELLSENRRLTRELAQQNEQLLELNRLLDERAQDATDGHALAQLLHESLGAGVITIDGSGLVVTANQRATQLIVSGQAELIGMPAALVLPAALQGVLAGLGQRVGAELGGAAVVGDKHLQWRASNCGRDAGYHALVLTLWEVVR